MPAIVINVLIVFLVLAVVGASLTKLALVYALLLGGAVAVAAGFLAYRMRPKTLNSEHDRNIERQAKPRKQFSISERKFVDGPSIVESRTTKQEHH